MSEELPHEAIWALSNGMVVSRCLHVVADLGVADHIGETPESADALALRCGCDGDALERVLRLLAAHGVFEFVDGAVRHTRASALLRSDHAMSMRALPRMMGLPGFLTAFVGLEQSVRTGVPSITAVAPDGMWAYFEKHPNEARIYGQAMTAKGVADVGAVLDAYDFSRFGVIADVGGGRGHLLRAVLDAAPGARGVLFDLPAVIAAVEVARDRLTTQAGDFFVDALPAADAYVLMDVIHDWNDAECVSILRAIRRAAAPGAVVLVVENVLDDAEPDPRGSIIDVIMLAISGGRLRTPGQLSELFGSSGFSAGTLIDTSGTQRIVEATAV
jgi:hypothetical protein